MRSVEHTMVKKIDDRIINGKEPFFINRLFFRTVYKIIKEE
jgi:hypothetical protein